MEDAGYTREHLGRKRDAELGGSVGVYVGVMYEEYQLYGAQEQVRGRSLALTGNPSSIANRVSYYFDFHTEYCFRHHVFFFFNGYPLGLPKPAARRM